MEGRLTVGLLHGEARTAWDDPEHIDPQQRESESWEHVPTVPCDDAAIERATQAAMDFDEETPNPSHDWYRDMALAMFRAAGETP